MKDDLISKTAAIDAVEEIPWYHQNKNGEMVQGANSREHQAWYKADDIYHALYTLPPAQLAQDLPKGCTDMISKRKVKYKLTALVNEIEEIFANIREREVNDSVCGLCEYDGAYIGQSGDWCNECPGFEKDNCFKLKDKYRAEWESIDG